MLIECLIRRKNGTHVDFGRPPRVTATYAFLPREEGGPHVCEVTDEAHAARFLAVREGYREVDPETLEPVERDAPVDLADTPPAPGGRFAPPLEGEGAGDGLPPLDPEGDRMPSEAPDIASMDVAEAREAYAEIMGKRPFNGWDSAELAERVKKAREAGEV